MLYRSIAILHNGTSVSISDGAQRLGRDDVQIIKTINMAVNGESKDENQKEIKKVKKWIGWSWTYLWGVWFLTMIFLLYILRNPLKLRENVCLGILNLIQYNIYEFMI